MDRNELEDAIAGRIVHKTGPERELEAMRFVYNNLVELGPAARQRVVDHVMAMFKSDTAAGAQHE